MSKIFQLLWWQLCLPLLGILRLICTSLVNGVNIKSIRDHSGYVLSQWEMTQMMLDNTALQWYFILKLLDNYVLDIHIFPFFNIYVEMIGPSDAYMRQ